MSLRAKRGNLLNIKIMATEEMKAMRLEAFLNRAYKL